MGVLGQSVDIVQRIRFAAAAAAAALVGIIIISRSIVSVTSYKTGKTKTGDRVGTKKQRRNNNFFNGLSQPKMEPPIPLPPNAVSASGVYYRLERLSANAAVTSVRELGH